MPGRRSRRFVPNIGPSWTRSVSDLGVEQPAKWRPRGHKLMPSDATRPELWPAQASDQMESGFTCDSSYMTDQNLSQTGTLGTTIRDARTLHPCTGTFGYKPHVSGFEEELTEMRRRIYKAQATQTKQGPRDHRRRGTDITRGR